MLEGVFLKHKSYHALNNTVSIRYLGKDNNLRKTCDINGKPYEYHERVRKISFSQKVKVTVDWMVKLKDMILGTNDSGKNDSEGNGDKKSKKQDHVTLPK